MTDQVKPTAGSETWQDWQKLVEQESANTAEALRQRDEQRARAEAAERELERALAIAKRLAEALQRFEWEGLNYYRGMMAVCMSCLNTPDEGHCEACTLAAALAAARPYLEVSHE